MGKGGRSKRTEITGVVGRRAKKGKETTGEKETVYASSGPLREW